MIAFVCMNVNLCVSSARHLLILGGCYAGHIYKRIVNIVKVHFELIRFRT